MPVDKLTGLVFYPDNDFLVLNFTGLKFEYIENLSIAVVDQFGDLISDAKISIQKNGGSIDEFTLPNGELFELVENETDYVITVLDTETHLAQSDPVTFTFDGSTSKSVVLEAYEIVPTYLLFPDVNEFRVVITQSPLIVPEKPEFIMFKDLAKPFFDNPEVFQFALKSWPSKVQYRSSYSTNKAQLRDLYTGNAVGSEIVASLIIDNDGIHDYNEYLIEVDWSSIPLGRYYLEFFGEDLFQGTYKANSEPIELISSLKGKVQILYYNNDDNADLTYAGTDIVHNLILPGRFVKPTNQFESDIYDDDSGSLIKLSDEAQKGMLLELYRVASYQIEKVNIALSFDFLQINGQLCTGLDKINANYDEFQMIASPKVRVPLKYTNLQNRHDNNSRP